MLNKLILFTLICLLIHVLNYSTEFNKLFTNLSVIFFNVIVAWWLTAIVLNNFYRKWFIKNVNSSDKIVLITGCDTGLGRIIALKLNKKGYHIFASCLSELNCEQLRKESHFPKKMNSFLMDITIDDHLDNCYKLIQKYLNDNPNAKFWSLVNNAGISCPGELEFGEFDKQYRSVFEVNTFGMAKCTRKFLPLLRKYNQNENSALNGRIVNMNSLAGRCVITPTSIYSMSKHATVAFTDALRNEMYKFNIKVISIEPYYYETMQTNNKCLNDGLEQNWKKTDIQIKRDYGFNYDKKLKALIDDKDFRRTVSKNIDEVADVVYESLSSYDPEDRYVCANNIMKFFLNIFNSSPREFIDLFTRLMQYKFGTNRID